MSPQHLNYKGGELELFARAVNWKEYWAGLVRPLLGRSVLEVGAGLGVNTRLLRSGKQARWVCLEPDPGMSQTLLDRFPSGDRAESAGEVVTVLQGTLGDMGGDECFDAILYIDVLEHIGDDRAELRRAAGRLARGGRLIVLAPAHPFLYSEFDEAVGHFRRYTRESLRAAGPQGLCLERLIYLDSVGLLASLANKLLLRRSMPRAGQIRFWDGILVRCSRTCDPVLGYRAGKSILAVWRLDQQIPSGVPAPR